MKNSLVFIFSVVLLSACQKDNNYCIEAIPYYLQPVCGLNGVTCPNWEKAECQDILN